MNWDKCLEREKYYLNLARQAVDTYERHCISPKGLAVPPAQINQAADVFKNKIISLMNRVYEVCWGLGIEQARVELEERGIGVTYIKIDDGIGTPGEDFMNARTRFIKEVDESKPILQQASGERSDLAHVRKVTDAIISVYANQAYTQAYLTTFVQMQEWMRSADLRGLR